jgi:hypothetical protein
VEPMPKILDHMVEINLPRRRDKLSDEKMNRTNNTAGDSISFWFNRCLSFLVSLFLWQKLSAVAVGPTVQFLSNPVIFFMSVIFI